MFKINYKLRKWIDIEKIDWVKLSSNPNAISLLEKNIDKIHWYNLCENPNAIPFLKKRLYKLFNDTGCFYELFRNPNAVSFLENNPDILEAIIEKDRTSLRGLAKNPNPDAISLIKNKLNQFDVIALSMLAENPNFIEIIKKDMNTPSISPLFKSTIENWRNLSKNTKIIWIVKRFEDNNCIISSCELSNILEAIEFVEKNQDKIDWSILSSNQNAIHVLEKNQDKIDWSILSSNQNAIPLLEKNLDKINWHNLSSNPNAIPLLEKNPDKIDWSILSSNPNAIPLLEKNIDKINWVELSSNPNIFEIEYKYEYFIFKLRCLIYKEELIQIAMHPSRIQKLLDMGISIHELDHCI